MKLKPVSVLYPISLIYRLIIAIRNFLYDRKVFHICKPQGKTRIISVGNIVAGGSGKTPFTIYLAEQLKNHGFSVAVLSRGYGRKSRGFKLVSDGEKILTEPHLAGEEPYLIALSVPEIPVAVNEDRCDGVRQLIDTFQPDIILLDDAFQHRRMARDVDIVLHPCFASGKYRRLIPAGYLRERFKSLKRADFILLTKGDKDDCHNLKNWLLFRFSWMKSKPVIRLHYETSELKKWVTGYNFESVQAKSIDTPLVAISGIAHPFDFEQSVKAMGINIAKHISYGDHHHYSDKDIEQLKEVLASSRAEGIITTMKDFIKLKPFLEKIADLQVYIPEVRVRPEDEDKFLQQLLSRLS